MGGDGQGETGAAAGGGHFPTLWILGLGGLLPFLAGTGALLYAGRDFIAFDLLVRALGGYGAAILSFLGGIRWGAALVDPASGRGTFMLSVLPAILGWILLLVPAPMLFAGFALAFLLQGVWDVLATRSGALPAAFRPLRITLTVVVVLCQIAAFFATSGAGAAASAA